MFLHKLIHHAQQFSVCISDVAYLFTFSNDIILRHVKISQYINKHETGLQKVQSGVALVTILIKTLANIITLYRWEYLDNRLPFNVCQ